MTKLESAALPTVLQRCGLTRQEIADGDRAQPAVYLLQRLADMTLYRFRWDVAGPQSIDLFYDLAAVPVDDRADDELAPEVATAADGVRDLLAAPDDFDGGQERWAQLVACVDFLLEFTLVQPDNGQAPPLIAENFSTDEVTKARDALERHGVRYVIERAVSV